MSREPGPRGDADPPIGGLPSVVSFGREICGRLDEAERREWWLANGRGGYAAGTVAGSLTRCYHGLLIASLPGSGSRVLAAAKADAVLIDGEREWPLHTNRWTGGAVEPEGCVHIESFRLEGRMPLWRYDVGGLTLEQRIWLEHGAGTAYVAYRLIGPPADGARLLRLRVRILVNARDHHGRTEAGGIAPKVTFALDRLQVEHDRFTLHVGAVGGPVEEEESWVTNFDLSAERERGLADRDSHFCVGHAWLYPCREEWVGLRFSVEGEGTADLGESMARFRSRDASLLQLAGSRVPEMAEAPEWVRQLVLAADSFLAARPAPGVPDGETVIAGYPWFTDWGRDAMISLPGLALATGRWESALRILRLFGRFVDGGMVPNFFPEGEGRPEYNSVDAALWYVEAWRAYHGETGDLDSLREAFPVMQSILEGYRRGARFGIAMDPGDGLLRAGEPGVQVTWMDAMVGGKPVTPRAGKAVEVNALWYNAHRAMAGMARLLDEPPSRYDDLADRIEKGFDRFAGGEGGGLADVIDGPWGDERNLRPNQILAVSLPHSPVPRDVQERIVALCGHHLLCSFGLRSLSPDHADYHPSYRGGADERDLAYHQGPVWPWLLGYYALAEHRVHGDAAAAQARLEPLGRHLLDAGLGTVSEIFDGAPPHEPRGCPAQAWSVAVTLESWRRLERSRRGGG